MRLYILILAIFLNKSIFKYNEITSSDYRKSHVLEENTGGAKTNIPRNNNDDPDYEVVARTFAVQSSIEGSVKKALDLIITDLYNFLVKRNVKRLYRFASHSNIRRDVRLSIESWWNALLIFLRKNSRFSAFTEKKLRKCFFKAGIRAYKKTAIDIRQDDTEYFFLTLINFKKDCILRFYGTESLLYERFKAIEDNRDILKTIKNNRKLRRAHLNRLKIRKYLKNKN